MHNKPSNKTYKKFFKVLKMVLILFFVSRIVLTLFGALSKSNRYYINIGRNYPKSNFINIWAVWDSAWYLNIADNGYSTLPHQSKIDATCCKISNFGFFPTYPILMRFLSGLVGGSFTAGLIISNLSLIISAMFLYYLTKEEFDERIAKLSVNALFLYPVAFIYSGIFTESTALLFSLASIYYAKKNNWFISGLFGSLFALTRVDGMLLAPVLFLLYLHQKRFDLKKIGENIFSIALVPAGTLIFMFYSYLVTNDFLYFFHLKSHYWHTRLENPFYVIAVMVSITIAKGDYGYTPTILMVISAFILIGYLLKNSKLSLILKIYTLIFTLVPAISGDLSLISFPRHTLLIFPIYIYLAILISKNTVSKVLTYCLLIPMQLTLMYLWVNGFIM